MAGLVWSSLLWAMVPSRFKETETLRDGAVAHTGGRGYSAVVLGRERVCERERQVASPLERRGEGRWWGEGTTRCVLPNVPMDKTTRKRTGEKTRVRETERQREGE